MGRTDKGYLAATSCDAEMICAPTTFARYWNNTLSGVSIDSDDRHQRDTKNTKQREHRRTGERTNDDTTTRKAQRRTVQLQEEILINSRTQKNTIKLTTTTINHQQQTQIDFEAKGTTTQTKPHLHLLSTQRRRALLSKQSKSWEQLKSSVRCTTNNQQCEGEVQINL